MKTSDFNYELPPELIAQTPIQRRDASRLLVLDKNTGAWQHRHFYDLPEYLRPGDCLILNNSRVLPARLLGHRMPGGGACEILLLIDRGDNVWECLVRPGKKLRKGARVSFGDGELTAEGVEELPGGNRLVHFEYEGIFLEVLDRLGKMPLPPYIKEELQDRERYQTVYSREAGSAAAPTAGLHFTRQLIDGLPLPVFVRNADGTVFLIGTGFSDAQRAAPPPVGSRIVYSCRGQTRHGLPRFPSFMRIGGEP